MSLTIVSIDPSTKKLALTITKRLDRRTLEMDAVKLSADPSVRCGEAFRSVAGVLMDLRDETGESPLLYLEKPLSLQNGQTTIALAKVSGCIHAAAAECHVPVYEVDNKEWKLHVVGKGNASKPEIAEFIRNEWPEAYDLAAGDQDLIDSSAIHLHGLRNAKVRLQLLRKFGKVA